MPCRNDYIPTDGRSDEADRVERMIRWLYPKIDRTTDPERRRVLCPDADRLDHLTADLCEALRGMSDDQLDRWVYDGRRAISRELAGWWEEHQDEDSRRVRDEMLHQAAVRYATWRHGAEQYMDPNNSFISEFSRLDDQALLADEMASILLDRDVPEPT